MQSAFDPDWDAAEMYWIDHYRRAGHRLTNHTDGGEGSTGAIISEHSREVQRQRYKQKWADGFKWTADMLAKRSATRTGQSYADDATREKMSRAKAHLSDAEVQAIYLDAHRGVPIAQLAEKYGVVPSVISQIKHNKVYKHVPRPPLPTEKTRSSHGALTDDQVRGIRKSYDFGEPHRKIAARLGIHPDVVRMIGLRRYYEDVPEEDN